MESLSGSLRIRIAVAITGLSWLTAWSLCVRAESFDESELSTPTFCRAPLATESSPIPDRDYESGVIPLAGHRLPPTELSDVLRRLEALESASLLPHAMHPIAEKEALPMNPWVKRVKSIAFVLRR